MILKRELAGNDCKKRIKDYLAFLISSPYIEPERSKRNMYYPL